MKKLAILAIGAALIAALAIVLVFGSAAMTATLGLRTVSIASGGQNSSGGDYRLQSSIAQPLAGAARGGNYDLTIGFLHPAGQPASAGGNIYLPMIRK